MARIPAPDFTTFRKRALRLRRRSPFHIAYLPTTSLWAKALVESIVCRLATLGRMSHGVAMELNHGLHLAYCTNIHRGETWGETLATLEIHALAVRDRLGHSGRFAIGLRLSAVAAEELGESSVLDEFRRWLDAHKCYVFTINGFPYGEFHGTRVKEQVYRPDWTTPERLSYTNRLFDILSALLPEGVQGSVSTLPGSFKEFITDESLRDEIYGNLVSCYRHIESLCERTGQDLHLGLEPEPLGLFETSQETVEFFDGLCARPEVSDFAALRRRIGVNYDTCHLATEFESGNEALGRLTDAGLRIGKLHLSSALRCRPTADARRMLKGFADDTYLHQVISAVGGNVVARYRDLDEAFAAFGNVQYGDDEEWRVHFHVPLHAAPEPPLADTRGHLLETLDWLAEDPGRCAHLEMETYTWEVLPAALKALDVEDQLVREYQWVLGELVKRGLASVE